MKIPILLKRTAISCVETCRSKLIVKYMTYRTVGADRKVKVKFTLE